MRRETRSAVARWMAAAALIGGLAVAVGAPSAQTAPPVQLPQDERGIPSLAPVLEKVQAAVVSIAVEGTVVQQNPLFNDPFFRRFFDVPEQGMERQFQSAGSGVVVDAEKGLIITNHHVVDRADDITITLMGGRTLKAEVVGKDPQADIAVLRVKADDLIAIPIGNSDDLRVGDFVVAIGNPFGLSQTVTSGIVSALGRSNLAIEEYEDFIQTDAAINPGNSGGALINLRGELIGVNTAITSPGRGGNVGIGFAIPVNMATSIMSQLVQYGQVRRGQLGVVIQDLDPRLAKGLGVGEERGAVITEVRESSPADKAGLRRGDIVTSVNGKPITMSAQLRNAVGLMEIGKTVTLDVIRDGKKRSVKAVIGQSPEATTAEGGKPEDEDGSPTSKLHPSLEGAMFGDAVGGDERGVQVTDVKPGTPAWNMGLRPGDRIVEANRQRVESLAQLAKAVAKRDQVLLLVERRDGALYLYGEK